MSDHKIQVYQDRLKSLAVQLTFAEEQERRCIAEDLHDHIGQSLALARMQLRAKGRRRMINRMHSSMMFPNHC